MPDGSGTGLESRGQQKCCGDRHLRPATHAFLAQLVEQRSFKPQVAGSIISPAEIIPGQTDNKVLNKDANWVAKHNPVDVLYLDPPYNHRQYATNYHLLETIAKNDKPLVHGKTGLREYSSQKSLYCSRTQVKSVFNDLIANAKAKYIFLSYNNEGLLAINDIKEIMEQRGQYGYATMDYHRFRADSTRDYKADSTIEYLHYVKCK